VAAPLPFSESELRLLQVLLKRKVRFMVVGLSAATLQGAPVVTQDVDLWFENLGEQKISRALQEVGAAYVPPSNLNPPMLAGAGAELFDIVIRMDGLGTFADEIKKCVDISLGRQKLKVLSLERILATPAKEEMKTDATKKLPGEGFKRPWPSLIKWMQR
jgi:hypothetical protein